MNRRSVDARPACRNVLGTVAFVEFADDLLLVLDLCVGTVLGYLSVQFYFALFGGADTTPMVSAAIWRELVLGSIIAALVVRKSDSGSSFRHVSVVRTLLSVLQRALFASIILFAVGAVTGTVAEMARLWLLTWSGLFLAWMCFSRLFGLALGRYLANRGALREAVAVIGAPGSVAGLVTRLRREADVVAVIDQPADDATSIATTMAQILALAQDGMIGLVVLALGQNNAASLAQAMVEHLKAIPVQVAVCTGFEPQHDRLAEFRSLAGVPMTLIANRPLSRRGVLAKLLMDKVGAILLLVMISPLLAAIAFAVMLDSPGPVIFRQSRTGWGGRPFTVCKFRTMRHDQGAVLFRQTTRGDPRCTSIGGFLRRTSLDELPQLWNVLRGDMSLVGPRPHADSLHARERASSALVADYAKRQRVKPGLTGWAQVHGLRGAADTPEKLRQRVELDLYYIENWSIWLDLRILARTPWAVLCAENAF